MYSFKTNALISSGNNLPAFQFINRKPGIKTKPGSSEIDSADKNADCIANRVMRGPIGQSGLMPTVKVLHSGQESVCRSFSSSEREGKFEHIQMHSNLKLGRPNDKYEQEADRVADHIMRKPFACKSNRSVSPVTPEKNRPCSDCMVQAKAVSNGNCSSAPKNEEEELDQLVQGKAKGDGLNTTNNRFPDRLRQSSSSGNSLPVRTRQNMETRFGHSFEQVRIHTDGQAADMTRQLNAKAFATNGHIYFGSGQYSPESFSGQHLLAHELTHILQQRAGAEKMIGTMRISEAQPAMLQAYELKGFTPARESEMHAAIATAISKVSNCDYLNWLGKLLIKTALRSMRYDYVPDLGYCGWTFPASWYIEVGEKAFDHSKCCDLASTLAHEASHTEWYTEGRARKMECECFSCSC